MEILRSSGDYLYLFILLSYGILVLIYIGIRALYNKYKSAIIRLPLLILYVILSGIIGTSICIAIMFYLF